MINTKETIQFKLPELLACPEPTELRNIARDDVRLLVTKGDGSVDHSFFNRFSENLQAGDVLVVNTSATQAAAFPIEISKGRKGMVHFSTQINHEEWLVEIREIKGNKTIRWKDGAENEVFNLPNKGTIKLKSKFYENRDLLHLWTVEVNIDQDIQSYMQMYGQPIKYENLDKAYPLDYYQTYFSYQPGSSEMPSAGRGFTSLLVNKLLEKGIELVPVLLHTGVSSLEENEAPYPEYMELSPASAKIINKAKRTGRRIVAVGTTAVRAVESATNIQGEVVPYKGNTSLYIQNEYKMRTINAMLTGFHEPKASHLNMLQSLAGADHIDEAYNAAIDNNYYWHQFGDLHLILP